MGAYGSLQVFIRRDGFQWVLMGLCRSLCVVMGSHES